MNKLTKKSIRDYRNSFDKKSFDYFVINEVLKEVDNYDSPKRCIDFIGCYNANTGCYNYCIYTHQNEALLSKYTSDILETIMNYSIEMGQEFMKIESLNVNSLVWKAIDIIHNDCYSYLAQC